MFQKLRNLNDKDWALILSALLGFCIPAYFAWEIYHAAQKPNMATWFMVLVLDSVGLCISWSEGNDRPYLQTAWVGGAILMVLAILLRPSTWHWGDVETISALCCLAAVIAWRTIETKKRAAVAGLSLQTLAVFISFFPQARDYLHTPEPSSWYLWFWSAIGCVAAIYGAKKHDAAHTFVPYAGIVLNLFFLALIRM